MPIQLPLLSRRDMLKALGITTGIHVSGVLAQEKTEAASSAASPAPIDPGSPRAVLLGFVTDHEQVDQARWVKKRDDVDGKQQCASCALFKATNTNLGICAIFNDRQVPATGWCNAWTGR